MTKIKVRDFLGSDLHERAEAAMPLRWLRPWLCRFGLHDFGYMGEVECFAVGKRHLWQCRCGNEKFVKGEDPFG